MTPIEKRKILIKEFLGCFSHFKKKDNYLDKLEEVRFINCSVFVTSEPTNFIRISETLITRKSEIDKIKIREKYYLVYFKRTKFPIKTTERYVKNIIEQVDPIIEN